MDGTMRTQQSHDATLQSIYSQHQMDMYAMVPQYTAQPPTLYSNGPSVMTPAGSPKPMTAHKPTILLDTDFDNTYYPSTPPLSTSGSTVGSPKSFDGLQTPMNPMFSGLDESETKEILEPADAAVLDWSSCGSPPMTPMYLQSQLAQAASFSSATSDPFSATSCPSLSPSPVPYARSIASEQDVDLVCDPRHLTVSTGPANPTLTPEASVSVSLGENDTRRIYPKSIATAAPQPTFDFNPDLPDGLPSFEDLSDFESEEDFVNSIVSLSGHQDTTEVGRPRAGTGSSVVSLGHGSFIGEEDLSFEDFGGLDFAVLPSPPSTIGSFSEDTHRDKRVKKSPKEACITPMMTNVAADADADVEVGQQHETSPEQDSSTSDSGSMSGSEGPDAPLPAPANRRGRKQSLTEDPSKTFVCDLCNRRFRRQEHLKRHYRSLHTQEKPFECNECGKKFSRSDNLAQHARTHGSGAVVMNLLEEGEVPAFETGVAVTAPGTQDYTQFGKVLFQIASEVPGSSGESSEDGEDGKKRKRSD